MHKLFSTRTQIILKRDTHSDPILKRDTHSDPNLAELSRRPLYIPHYLRSAFNDVSKVSEKRTLTFIVRTIHNLKTSTSAGIIFETIWLNLIGSICFHMSQNIWTILTHQSKCQQKQFLMRLYPSTHDKSWHPEKRFFPLSLDSEHRRGSQKISKRKNQKVVLTNNHTNPSILQ